MQARMEELSMRKMEKLAEEKVGAGVIMFSTTRTHHAAPFIGTWHVPSVPGALSVDCGVRV